MRRAAVALGIAAASFTLAAAPAQASTASRLKALERSMKAATATNKAQASQITALRRDLTATSNQLASTGRTLSAAVTLLLGCFGSTSMDLDATTSFFTGSPFITVSLNSSAAGPFYLATLNPACVGAITPPITPGAARSARPMFPNAHLPLPALR